MLPDQITQLLTAFVDGELGQRQREAVIRLLNQSAEARELVRQLQENAHRIKQLPRRKVEPSLVDEITKAIANEKMQPARPMVRKSGRRSWLPYLAASMAASVLIGAIGLLYWKYMGDQQLNKNNAPIVITIKPPIEAPRPPSQPPPMTPVPRKPNPLLALVDETFRDFGAPVPVDPPFVAKFADLQKDDAKAGQFAYELGKDKVIQFDITVKNNSKALIHLRAALAERGIKLVEDPAAAKAIKDKSKAKVEYLVYAENITTDELTKLMNELGQPMVVPGSTNQKTEPSTYQRVTVAPAAKDDRQRVAKLLGVDAIEQKANTEVKPDPNVVRQAVVLPASASGTPSSEIRQFVNQRLAPQRGTVQVLIKIRQE